MSLRWMLREAKVPAIRFHYENTSGMCEPPCTGATRYLGHANRLAQALHGVWDVQTALHGCSAVFGMCKPPCTDALQCLGCANRLAQVLRGVWGVQTALHGHYTVFGMCKPPCTGATLCLGAACTSLTTLVSVCFIQSNFILCSSPHPGFIETRSRGSIAVEHEAIRALKNINIDLPGRKRHLGLCLHRTCPTWPQHRTTENKINIQQTHLYATTHLSLPPRRTLLFLPSQKSTQPTTF